MINLLPLLTFAAEKAQENFVRKTPRIAEVQEKFLFNLLREYQDTELGRYYQLHDIATIEQFQQRVPVLSYTDYIAYVERIAAGEKNMLTPDPVVYLNKTSGSTGKQKLIPVTRRFQNILGWANLTSIGFLSKALRSRGTKFGPGLVINQASEPDITPGGIEYGCAGPGVLRMNKFLFQQVFVHPFEALKPTDTLTRSYLCLLFALNCATAAIAGNFPMVILQACKILEDYAEDLIHDLQTGTLASWLQLDSPLRISLEAQHYAAPKRAAQLQDILQSEGKLTPISVWPNLAFYGTARGGTTDFYLERFPEYFGNTPGFGFVFSTAEGTFSMYPDVNVDGSVLAIETGFFEFVPPQEWESAHPKTVLAQDVKVGELYRILMTNHSGFYRYDIGDVFEVVGFYEQTPLIVFRYRRGGILSSVTEKTTEYHATKVMQMLQQQFDVTLEDFCLTLSDNEFPARYLVNIELASGHYLSDPQGFIQRFDRLLKEIQSHYELKRQNLIPPPRLRIMAPGSFDVIRQRQIERGIPEYQLKFPHISEDRNFTSGMHTIQEFQLEH